MPIYDFRCAACEITFEQFCRTVADATSVVCADCGGAVSRRFSPFRLGGFAPGPIDGDTTERTESKSGCSSCATQACSTCSVL